MKQVLITDYDMISFFAKITKKLELGYTIAVTGIMEVSNFDHTLIYYTAFLNCPGEK